MKNILTSLAIFVIGIVVVFNTPTSWFSWQHWFGGQRYGSFAYTSLNNTDTIANFPSLWNTTFSNVSANLFSLADWYATTSATQLVKVGTLTTGTWNASTITVPYGGTGSTTLSQYAILLGSSTNAIDMVQGLGTAGQILTSNGAGARPSWTSATFDTTQNYSLIGSWNLAGAATRIKNLIASTTMTLSNGGAGYSVVWPSSQASAANTSLQNDGSGNLSWGAAHATYSAYNTTGTTATNGYATTTMLTIPANILNASSTITIRLSATCSDSTALGNCYVYLRDGTGATFGSVSWSDSYNASCTGSGNSGPISFVILPNNSLSAQQTIYNAAVTDITFCSGVPSFTGTRGGGSAGTSAINMGNATTINVVIRSDAPSVTMADSGISVIVNQ